MYGGIYHSMNKPEQSEKIMSEQLDNLTCTLIQAYHLMQDKGRWMDSGTIELNNGESFSYKISRLKDKKRSKK